MTVFVDAILSKKKIAKNDKNANDLVIVKCCNTLLNPEKGITTGQLCYFLHLQHLLTNMLGVFPLLYVSN